MLKRKLAASLITGIALAAIAGGAFAGINESNDPYFEWRPVPVTKRTFNAEEEARKSAAAGPVVPNFHPSQDPYFAWKPVPLAPREKPATYADSPAGQAEAERMSGPFHQVEKHTL